MGAQKSKSTSISQSINNSLTKIAVEASQECASNTANIQTLNISDIKTKNCKVKISGISQDAYIVSDMSCVNDQKLATDIQNSLKEQLKQETKAVTEGLGGIFSQSETKGVKQSVKNVMNNIDTKMMSSCIKDDYNKQDFNISDLEIDCSGMENGELDISNISQALMSKTITNCFNQQSNAATAVTEMEEKVEQAQDASTKGMQLSGSGGVSMSLSTVLSSFMIFLILSVLSMMGVSAPEQE